MGQKKDKDALWAEAKKRCRLNDEDTALAKKLGFAPRDLIKNIPNKAEPWKAPVKQWIHDIAEKREREALKKKRRRESEQARLEKKAAAGAPAAGVEAGSPNGAPADGGEANNSNGAPAEGEDTDDLPS
jgi:hypothetical protein